MSFLLTKTLLSRACLHPLPHTLLMEQKDRMMRHAEVWGESHFLWREKEKKDRQQTDMPGRFCFGLGQHSFWFQLLSTCYLSRLPALLCFLLPLTSQAHCCLCLLLTLCLPDRRWEFGFGDISFSRSCPTAAPTSAPTSPLLLTMGALLLFTHTWQPGRKLEGKLLLLFPEQDRRRTKQNRDGSQLA